MITLSIAQYGDSVSTNIAQVIGEEKKEHSSTLNMADNKSKIDCYIDCGAQVSFPSYSPEDRLVLLWMQKKHVALRDADMSR